MGTVSGYSLVGTASAYASILSGVSHQSPTFRCVFFIHLPSIFERRDSSKLDRSSPANHDIKYEHGLSQEGFSDEADSPNVKIPRDRL